MSKSKKKRKSSSTHAIKNTDKNNTVVNQLQKYDINYSIVKVDEDELVEKGYKKIPKSEIGRVSMLLQHVPGMLASEATRTVAKASTDKKMIDAYRVVIPEGMHLAKKKAIENAYLGGFLSNQTNQVSGQASLYKLNPVEISRTPQLVLGAFNVMSAVTGQYYLSKIDQDLNGIKGSVDSIQTFLAEDKKSKILAADKTLNNIFENLEFIKHNDWQRVASLGEVKDIKRQAIADFQFYGDQVQSKLQTLSPQDKTEIIGENVGNIGKCFPLYWCALVVYTKAEILDVLLSDMGDMNYLLNVSSQIGDYRGKYYKQYLDCKSKFTQLFTMENASFSDKVVFWTAVGSMLLDQYTITKPAAAALGVSAMALDGGKLGREKEIKNQIDEILMVCGNMNTIDSIRVNLDEYCRLQNNPVEVLETDETTYIKTYDSKDKIEDL